MEGNNVSVIGPDGQTRLPKVRGTVVEALALHDYIIVSGTCFILHSPAAESSILVCPGVRRPDGSYGVRHFKCERVSDMTLNIMEEVIWISMHAPNIGAGIAVH